MRIRMNDSRDRLYETLLETVPVGTKSGALDEASRFYCLMVGGNGVNPGPGKLKQLMEIAVNEGSVTPEQIADVLTTDEVPLSATTEWSVGKVERD